MTVFFIINVRPFSFLDSCVALTIPMCQSLNYTAVWLPNKFGHQSIEDAGMEAHMFYPLTAVIKYCDKNIY